MATERVFKDCTKITKQILLLLLLFVTQIQKYKIQM